MSEQMPIPAPGTAIEGNATMTDPVTIAHCYIKVWNEVDPAHRRRLMEASWIEDARYVDPMHCKALAVEQETVL